MKLNPVKLGPFLGVNNRLPRHALNTDNGTYLADAVNTDIDVTGRLAQAKGGKQVISAAGCHSVFGSASEMLFATNGSLRRVTNLATLSHVEIDTVTGSRVAYEEINGEIFYSDGSKLACLQTDGTVRRVGIPVPQSMGVSITTGSLPPAWYQVSITYFAGTLEGPAYPSANMELTVTGGLRIDLPTPPSDVTAIGIYVSGPNGEVPMLHSVIAPTASVTVQTEPTLRACQTQFKAPMPPGNILTSTPGRLFSASGNAVFYSDLYNFGLTTPGENYIQFPEDVTVMIGCGNGLYVVADKAYWITGIGTADMLSTKLLPYGAIKYSQTAHPTEMRVFWLSRRGLVTGDDAGQIVNMQEKNLLLDLTGQGASLFIEGNNRVVTTNG